MILNFDDKIRNVYGLTEEEERGIKHYLKGMVYCWCNKCRDEWFSLRDLVGGDSYYWQGTPMFVLFEKYSLNFADEQAVNMAGKDVGWMLMKILEEDNRKFETRKGYTREYKYVAC